MRNPFNKILFISLLLTVFICSRAYSIPVIQDNCSDESNGRFMITVENPIQIEVNIDFIDAGEICPGCYLTYNTCDCPNIIYKVTGGSNCYFNYQAFMPSIIDGVGISIIIYYFDIDAKSWLRAKTNQVYSFDDNGEALLQACVHEIMADCTSDAGEYDFPLRLYVQYTCGSI